MSGNGVGCAVIHKNTANVSKLLDYASVFTAELTAIATALDQVFSSSDSNSVMYCDSRSTLKAVEKFNSFHPLVQTVQEWLMSPVGTSQFISVGSLLMLGYTEMR